jgi:hypothetical protein
MFLFYFTKNSKPIAHNVPAVYDVFAVAIRETVGFQQPQKCGGEKTHKGRSPTAFFRSPKRRQAFCVYRPVRRSSPALHIISLNDIHIQ